MDINDTRMFLRASTTDRNCFNSSATDALIVNYIYDLLLFDFELDEEMAIYIERIVVCIVHLAQVYIYIVGACRVLIRIQPKQQPS